MKFRPSVRIGVAIFGVVAGIVFALGYFQTMMPVFWFSIGLITVSATSIIIFFRARKRHKNDVDDFEL